MASETVKFQCTVITPQGTLVNCGAVSAILPAHDGFVGILANHMPFFCKLGLGIMRISSDGSLPAAKPDIVLLLDGGYAMVCANVLTVIASSAVSPAHTKKEKIMQDIETLRKHASDSTTTLPQRLHNKQKAALLEKLITSAVI